MAPHPVAAPAALQLPDLAALVPGVSATPGVAATVTETVVDTADGRLAARGARLVHRRSDGDARGEWSLRLPGGPEGLQWAGTADDVPEAAVALSRGLVRGAGLARRSTTTTTRHPVTLADELGTVAEVVDVVVDTPAQRLRHVEVDGRGSRAKAVRRALRALLRAGDDRPGDAPSAGDGSEVGGQADDRGDEAPGVEGDPLRAFVATVIGSGFDRLLTHDPHLRHDGGVDAVHQARVATRRLRADLRTLGPLLDTDRATGLGDELRWLGGVLGAVRDADVLADRLEARAAAHPDLPEVAQLVATARRQRDAAMAELRGVLDDPRYVRLLDELAAAVAEPPVLDGVGGDPARALVPLVGRARRRLTHAIAALPDTPSAEQLHRVRIRAKQARYAAEAASEVLGRRARTLASAAADLQGVLGDHHDAVVAAGWLREVAATVDPPVAFAAGVLVGDEAAAAVGAGRAWPSAARRVRATPRPRA